MRVPHAWVFVLVILGLVTSGCAEPSDTSGEPALEPVVSALPALTARAQGFDISHHQNDVEWSRIDQAFVYVKATEGLDLKDPRFEENWQAAGDADLLRGSYHMFRANDDVGLQVDFFVGTLTAAGFGASDLPPVLDVESNSGTHGLAKEVVAKRALDWMRKVEDRLGRRPVLYTNPNYWDSELDSASGLLDFPLWIARYEDAGSGGSSDPKELGQGWSSWVFWQHTESGELDGISTAVDLNFFNGTAAELQEFVASSGRD